MRVSGMGWRFSKGIWYMVLASFFFSLMSVLVKASGMHLPPQELVFFRSVFVAGLTLLWLHRKGLPLLGRNRRLLFLRGLFGYLALSAFFYTLTHIPIADSVILQYTNALFAALLSPWLLKERNTARDWRYFALAFSGLVLIVRPGFSLQASAAAIGLLGACCSAVAYILVRRLRQTDHELHIILAFPMVSIVFSAPFAIRGFVMPRGWEWLMLAGIGATTMIAQLLMTRALHLERAARATNASYVAVVFSTLWGLVLWGEIPTWPTLLGALIVILAVVRLATGMALTTGADEVSRMAPEFEQAGNH